jgi:carboxyl-terminal processing protease
MNLLRPLEERIEHFRISRQLQMAAIVVVVFVAGFALGNQHGIIAAQGTTGQPPGTENDFAAFWQTYNMIQSSYVGRPVDISKLVDGATKGMVDALGDEFSGYMDAQSYPTMSEDLSGHVEGIGVVIETNSGGQIEVVNVLNGSPAQAAGVRPGDVFLKVNGDDVSHATQFDLAQKVRGPAGSSVDITFGRDGQDVDLTITRADITVPNVQSSVLDGDIGYIKLNQFVAEARTQLDDALKQLDAQNLHGLILDLRGDPGGYLNSAIDVASAFVKDGPVVIEDYGNNSEQVYNATGAYAGITAPMVVLVDKNSASASEIVAGALQDRGVATIMGETSFGKGTVQTWQQLVNGGGLRLTIARWLTPNHHWIHGQGITPNIVVNWSPDTYTGSNDPQLDAALHFLESPASVQAAELAAQPTAEATAEATLSVRP